MKTFNFTIIASGLNPQDEDFEERFWKSGCGDATISYQKGAIILEFSREAKSFAHALLAAIENVLQAGAKVLHVEPDYYVSLAEIAKRTGLSRSALTLFAKGERGAEFPPPVARVTTDNPLWDWVSVARWMFRKRRISRTVVVEAKLIKQANLALHDVSGFEHSPFAKQIRAKIDEDKYAHA
jgi:hypothetical protein